MQDTMEWLSPYHAAYLLHCSPSTVYNRFHRGLFPGAEQTPDGLRIPRSAIEPEIAAQAAMAAATAEEVIQACAATLIEEYKRLTGLDHVPRPAQLRIAEALRTAEDLDDAA